MLRRRDIVAQFSNVGAGLTATAEIPTDRRYHAFKLRFTNNALVPNQATLEGLINKIRIMVDGKEQREVSAKELNAIALTYGQGFSDGIIPIFLSEPWRKLVTSEDHGAWAMFRNARNMSIEIDIDATAVNPTLECRAEFDDGLDLKGSPLPLGDIKKYTRQVVQVGEAGLVTIDGLPLLGSYSRLHVFEGADGDVTNAVVKVGERVIYNVPRDLMEDGIIRRGGTLPASLFSIAFDETSRLTDVLNTVTMYKGSPATVPVRLELTLANSNNFTLVSEVWGRLN